MGLTQRKPRPICRDEASLRDDRLFIIASDDTYAPKQYFAFFNIPRVQVHVIATENNNYSAEYVLERLLELEHEPDDERWILLDVDHHDKGRHQRGFIAAIRKAKQKGIKIALSKPCFEFWLLLHHIDIAGATPLENAQKTEALLRKSLGEYNKTKLKSEHYPYSLVIEACRKAKKLDNAVPGGDIPTGNTSRVYLLWEAIIANSLPSGLPSEFKKFREKLI